MSASEVRAICTQIIVQAIICCCKTKVPPNQLLKLQKKNNNSQYEMRKLRLGELTCLTTHTYQVMCQGSDSEIIASKTQLLPSQFCILSILLELTALSTTPHQSAECPSLLDSLTWPLSFIFSNSLLLLLLSLSKFDTLSVI